MKASKGPSATVLSFMIVGSFLTPIVFTAGTVAFAFIALLSQ